MTLRTVELFAGIGGFRLALDRVRNADGSPAYTTIWNNQWEPGETAQFASKIYQARFGADGHSNEDIEKVVATRFRDIPDHDLLVGGFPCQDYSVARMLDQATGLTGQKGVLWWSIQSLLERKKNRPQYLLLENVDRLLISPSKQRGRDFAVMLASLSDLGYAIEWRVINAGDFGMAQRRRRVFFIGYHKDSELYQRIQEGSASDWIMDDGTMAQAFPCRMDMRNWPANFELEGDLAQITNQFNLNGKGPDFCNSGLMMDRKVTTVRTLPVHLGPIKTLGDVLQPLAAVDKKFYINPTDLPKWKMHKGGKKVERIAANGHRYIYAEGSMPFPDPLDRPSRTIITGEGATGPNRSRHVVEQDGQLRRLTPVELERLMGFPDNHTEGALDTRRARLLGNALVVDVVQRLGTQLAEAIIQAAPATV